MGGLHDNTTRNRARHRSTLPLRNLGPPEAFDCAEFTKSVTQILSDSDAVVLVADTGPQLVGMAEVYVKVDAAEPTKPSRKYGYLQSLMVRSDQRRQGIATRLVEQAEQWAREQGVHEMRLETWEFDGGPNLFYEGIGYQTFRRMWVRHL